MAIGQVSSNSAIIGTQVFNSQTSGNTGIRPAQIKPLDLSGQEAANQSSDALNLAPTAQVYNGLGVLASQGPVQPSGQRLNLSA